MAEAKNQLPRLICAAESGKALTITRHGRPVVRLVAVAPDVAKVRLGAMRGRIRLLPGWDDPIGEGELLDGCS